MSWRMKKLAAGDDITAIKMNVAANQTIKKDDVLVLSAGLVAKAGAAATALLGVAGDDITTGASPVAGVDAIHVYIQPGIVYTVPYTPGTKTTFAQADIGSGFGILATGNINPDNTTQAVAKILDYNNTAKTVDVVIALRSIY